jgi:hypothetical protein
LTSQTGDLILSAAATKEGISKKDWAQNMSTCPLPFLESIDTLAHNRPRTRTCKCPRSVGLEDRPQPPSQDAERAP